MNPVLPVIVTGPAILIWNGYSYYTKSGITMDFKRETFNVESDTDGRIDERMKSQQTDVTFTPVGMINSLTKYFPYGVGNVGSSLFGASPLPLVIQTKFGGGSNTGQTITFPKSAVSKTPPLRLHSQDTLFGDMAFTCLGVPTVQQNVATAWSVLVDNAFADATFDETKIVTDIYQAAYGSSPYNAMGSMNGFEMDLGIETENIYADDFGLAEIILKSLIATCRFTPSSLTEAQYRTLLAAQDSTFVFPGQSLSKSNTNFVVAGTGNNGLTLTATIINAGPKQGQTMYSTGKHRLGPLEFTSKRTWTGGTPNALFTLAIT